MKKLILLILFAITPLRSYDDSQYLKQIFFAKDIDFKPVFIQNLKLNPYNSNFILGDEYVFNQKYIGYSYYDGFDVSKFKNKTVGSIFDEFSRKFKFIAYKFSNFQINDSNSHEYAGLWFRNGDNYLIEIVVYIEPDKVLKTLGSDRSLKSLLKIESYFAIITKVDLLTMYCRRRNLDVYTKKIDGLEYEFLIDSLSKNVYDKIINAGIDYKCE